jgi:hypothetical protein
MRILLVLMLATSMCDTASAPGPLPPIAITSEGGIAGRGVGGVRIEESRVSATDMRRTCSGTLTDAERAELAALKPIAAREEQSPGRPDQIRYTMTVGEMSASWYGEDPPTELAPIFRVVWRIRARVLASC